ncbi:MAG TPA: dienelactone hydrolase family protein [candidate division Zixibacteria bacterium]|nr:dienelactone hydrolase family protein [candidate division Zixibacteria bacterium]
MKIVNRGLSAERDGIPGYLAHPDRREPGPGVMIVHHHFGVTGHMKSTVCNLARLGYTTIVPDLYEMLGVADGVHEAQKNTTDGQFVEILDRSWRYLTGRADVDGQRCAVIGYCMGGRIGIHFVAATPGVRCFVGYYPSVRDEGPSRLRPRHPCEAAREFRCPSLIFFGAQDHVAPLPVQQRLMESFQASGQPLDWHLFHRAGHGFALADGDNYDPKLAELAWSLAAEFLARELENE